MDRINVVETDLDFALPLETRSETNFLVIHHTGSGAYNDIDCSAEQIHRWHLGNGWAGIGYHYVVRKDGTVERGRPHWAVGSHAYGRNYESIGIHLSGDFSISSPTSRQIEQTALLIANICTDYGLPIDRQHVFGHREVGESSCPGDVLFGLLDTIVGKANYYCYGAPEEQGKSIPYIIAEKENTEMRYNTLEEIPDWASKTIEKMIANGLLGGGGMKDADGNPTDLDLSIDMIRVFVVNDRAGVYDN